MVCRFKDFALVVFKLLIFQVCGIIRVTKRSFSNISGTERVNSKTEGDFEVFPEITVDNFVQAILGYHNCSIFNVLLNP